MIRICGIEKNLKALNMVPISIETGVVTLFEQTDRAIFDTLYLKDISSTYGVFDIDGFDVLSRKKTNKNLSLIDIDSSVFSISCAFLTEEDRNINLELQNRLQTLKTINGTSEEEATDKIKKIISIIVSFSPTYILINFLKEENIKFKSIIKSQILSHRNSLAIFELESGYHGVKFDKVETTDNVLERADYEIPILTTEYSNFLKKNVISFVLFSLSFLISLLGLSLFCYSLRNSFALYAILGLAFAILGIVSGIFFLNRINQGNNEQYSKNKEMHAKMLSEFFFSFLVSAISICGVFLLGKLNIIFSDLSFEDYVAPISSGLILTLFSTFSLYINDFAKKMVNNIRKTKRKPINSEVKKHNKNQKDQLDD